VLRTEGTLDRVKGNARLAEAPLAEEVAAALDATDKDVEIGGAGLAAGAIELGLVDELHIFRNPVLVGGGTPLLPPVTKGVSRKGYVDPSRILSRPPIATVGRSVMGLVVRDDGWRMPDWLWERIEPLLPDPPPHPLGCHRPRVPDRDAMDAIMLVLRTGMQWNALNLTGPCSSSSAHRRFQEWVEAGVFHEIWRQGLLDYDEQVGIDWDWLAADGAMTKAPLGGPKTGPNPTDRAKKGRSVRFSRRPPASRSGSPTRAPTATIRSS
jgi:transposase